MLGGDEARIDQDAAGLDAEVVIAVAEVEAADLHQLQAAARRAIERRVALQLHHSVRHTLQLQVIDLSCAVVEEQHGDVAASEELLQRQDLLAVTEGALSQQTDLGERVEDDARRFEPVDLRQHGLDGLSQLHFRGIEDGGVFLFQRLLANELLEHIHAGHVPVMGLGHGMQFVACLGQRQVKSALAAAHALEQKLQPQGGLPDPRIPLQQVHVVAGEAA